MRPQLIQRTIDHRHADRLAAALALEEHFDGDRFDRIRRTHALSAHRRGSIVVVMVRGTDVLPVRTASPSAPCCRDPHPRRWVRRTVGESVSYLSSRCTWMNTLVLLLPTVSKLTTFAIS